MSSIAFWAGDQPRRLGDDIPSAITPTGRQINRVPGFVPPRHRGPEHQGEADAGGAGRQAGVQKTHACNQGFEPNVGKSGFRSSDHLYHRFHGAGHDRQTLATVVVIAHSLGVVLQIAPRLENQFPRIAVDAL